MLHKSKHKSPATRSVAGSAALPDNAGAALRASSFKEAIEGYKELLKRERRPEWLAGLAAAYAGRAAQLAANVEFTGFLTGPELHEVIRDSRAVVLPSEWYENDIGDQAGHCGLHEKAGW